MRRRPTSNRKHHGRPGITSILSCAHLYNLLAFSNNSNHVSVIAVVEASPQGGVLPPPPPPPPPPPLLGDTKRPTVREIDSSNRRLNADADSSTGIILSSQTSGEKPDDGWKSSISMGIGTDSNRTQSNEDTITTTAADDVLIPITQADAKDDRNENSVWESSGVQKWQYQPPEDNVMTQQSYAHRQPWGSAHAPSQYTDHHYDQGQRQHQQHQPPPQHQQRQQHHRQQQSLGQRYQQPRQQQNYQQQQQLHQVWSYQSQHTQLPQPQQQPQPPAQVVALYRRPSPPAVASRAKQSASILFSLAIKKLQTGIDTVSETLDANKVVSGVSSLTSKFGTIGSSITSGLGGHSSLTPQNTMVAGPTRMSSSMAASDVNPGMMRPPPYQSQQQGKIRNVQQIARQPGPATTRLVKKESYAPPMSELFPMEQDVQCDGMVDGVSNATDDVTFTSLQSKYSVKECHGEVDMNLDTYDTSMSQWMPPLSQPHPLSYVDDMEPNLFQTESPRSRTTSPQRGQRNTLLSPNLRNGNQMTNPHTTASRQREQDTVSRRRDREYDDDDDSSLGQKIKSVIGAVRDVVPNIFQSPDVSYDDGSWSDDEASESSFRGGIFSRRQAFRLTSSSSRTRLNPTLGRSTLVPRPVQSLLEKRETLLSAAIAHKCASIGRSQAILDVGQLALVVSMLREIVPIFFRELPSIENAETFEGGIRLAVISSVLSSLDGWAPYALAAALLLSVSNKVWIQPALEAAFAEAASENASDAAYTQLYLRLIASIPIQTSFSSEIMKESARCQAFQISSSTRLRSFAMLLVLYTLLVTVAVLRPAVVSVASAVTDVIQLSAWREAPIDVTTVLEGVKSIAKSSGYSLYGLVATEMEIIQHQPLRVFMVVSLLVALISISYFPSLEKPRKRLLPSRGGIDDDYFADEDMDDTITSLWSNLGSSSATRLGLLSSTRGVEGALDQFTKLRPDRAVAAGIANAGRTSMLARRKKRRRQLETSSFKPLLKKCLYSISTFIILSVPLTMYIYILKPSDAANGIGESGWVSLLELAALLAFAHFRTGDAVRDVIKTNDIMLGSSVTYFFQKLLETVTEMKKLASESSLGADFQAMLTASPTKGITVTDFWAAHSSRRAWATKGANINCQNGEVVLIIGEDGGGKTRLLTAITEQIFSPPKLARTTTYVRGSIHIAGVELSKWDKTQLQKRVGIFLNDVRTLSDYSSLLAGCTLEEILEPVNESGRTSPKEKNSMSVAMKITGLGAKVLTRLPSKLSTVVVANEDELKPSSTLPSAYPLSPSDWSRVLLTKILAQLISGNDSQPTTRTVRKCLVGSILLLDDATSQMNEVDEANIIKSLRSTGAATLLTSNRWAAGRFADRIVVVDSGSVVEIGTHSELINLGSERSLYASQWEALSSI